MAGDVKKHLLPLYPVYGKLNKAVIYYYVLVVQRIEQAPPKRQIWVRFPSGTVIWSSDD